MSLSEEQLTKIAALSKIKVNDGQIKAMQAPINNIMGLADQLAKQPTEGVEPLAHPLEIIQQVALPLRSDQVAESDQRQANMANAPASQNDLFLVPKVID